MLIVRHFGTPNSGFNGCHCMRDPVLYRSMKQTREKVCGLRLNANMQNQNKYFGNSQSFAPFFQLNFRHCICDAIFIILESQSEKL